MEINSTPECFSSVAPIVVLLYERQSSCSSGEFLCSASLGGGCCPIGSTCTPTSCDTGSTTCTGAGQEVCGINCCDSPLVCSTSLECVQGSEGSVHSGKSFILVIVLISGTAILRPIVSVVCGLGFIAIVFGHYA